MSANLITQTYSASKVALVRECPRRAYFRDVAKLEEPEAPGSSKAQALRKGKEIHAILEEWLAFKTIPDLTSEMALRARPGFAYLPPPTTPGLALELEVELVLMGYPFKQFMDLWVPNARALPHVEFDLPAHTPCVGDHKTTKNPKKKWEGKKPGLSTPEDFLSDPQFLTYAVSAFKLVPKATHVMGRWIYYATEGSPYAEPRDVLASKEDVARGVRDHVLPWSEALSVIRRKTSHYDVPARASFCHKYKSNSVDPAKRAAAPGCGYQAQCDDVTDADRMLALL